MKISFPCEYSLEELQYRWDEFTSPARFAGSDENMDLVFVSHRKGNKVRLVRKATASKEPFTCVFSGKLNKTENGSEVVGSFRKTIFDYIIVGALLLVLFYIRMVIMSRGENLGTINILLVFALAGGTLLLRNSRRTKRLYSEFIFRITEIEKNYFLPRRGNEE